MGGDASLLTQACICLHFSEWVSEQRGSWMSEPFATIEEWMSSPSVDLSLSEAELEEEETTSRVLEAMSQSLLFSSLPTTLCSQLSRGMKRVCIILDFNS